RARVSSYVARLVGRKRHRLGPVYSAFAHRFAVVVQRRGPAFAQSVAVVGEFHSYLMLAGWDGRVCGDDVVVDSEKVVAVLELSFVRIQGPATDAAALRDDHTVGAGF